MISCDIRISAPAAAEFLTERTVTGVPLKYNIYIINIKTRIFWRVININMIIKRRIINHEVEEVEEGREEGFWNLLTFVPFVSFVVKYFFILSRDLPRDLPRELPLNP